MAKDVFDSSTAIEIRDALNGVLLNSSRFNWKLYEAFAEAYSVYLNILFKEGNTSKDLAELEKIIRKKIGNIFNTKFRDDNFIATLSNVVASYSNLAKAAGFGKIYQRLSNLWSVWDNDFVEPLRDTLWRTPSYEVTNLEKYSLFRYYYKKAREGDKNNDRKQPTTPLLIVYAFINRHYILDLLPEISVVGNLLRQGFDVFATDWGSPSAYDKDLTIGHFVNSYMDRSVDLIREITKSDKVSLFGYCWGGNLVLIYAALHPEKVKNVITIATPGDSSLDDTLLSVWTKGMDVDTLLNAFGNVPSTLLNEAFALRNPVEYSHKYPHFFEQPHGLESIMEFLATETWLYDSPPVIGEIYREFVQYCYQQNLFIRNKMMVDGVLVNLKDINMPFLNVVAQRDDLVASRSSIALNNAVGSIDKSAIEFQSGHVGLIIGQRAHQEVWPKVGDWLRERS
ncbi:MAG: alpha/beta fold hydrolase [Thermoproteota archaeon]|nr:alpha/beta fold hydrolase [Thermoproteota archaeon]